MSCVCVSCAYKHVCLCVRVSPVIISRMGHPALRGCQQTKYLICFGFCFSVRWSKLCFHSVDKWDSGETIHGVCVCLFERKEERKEGRGSDRAHMLFCAVSYSCFWVCFCCYPWLMLKEIPCFPHRDTLCHLFLSESTTSENSNCMSALLYHTLLPLLSPASMPPQ